MLQLDPVTVAAANLAEGVAYAQIKLGVEMPFGGQHPLTGTHNHLLRLGDDSFLEVIAPDPSAPALERPGWFGLDSAAARSDLAGSPRLWTWVARTDDLGQALQAVEGRAGPAVRLSRGSLWWLMGVPNDGSLPFEGAFPTLMERPKGPHPASSMAERGCRLLKLTVHHPRSRQIAALLHGHLEDRRLVFEDAPACRLVAEIETPDGVRGLD
jgi:hypothetical protein